jgi:hypothetical protein
VNRDGRVRWAVKLGPCDGRVFMVTPEPIAAVKITAPHSVPRGAAVDVEASVVGPAGTPIPAVIPVDIAISDSAGRLAEFTGNHAAIDGRLKLKLQLGANDATGVWQIRVRELATNKQATVYMRVSDL